MEGIYSELIKGAKSLRKAQVVDLCGMDDFLTDPNYALPDKVKIASLGDLRDFLRIAKNTLVHKAERDLWRVNEKDGEVIIERLFDPDTNKPIRV